MFLNRNGLDEIPDFYQFIYLSESNLSQLALYKEYRKEVNAAVIEN